MVNVCINCGWENCEDATICEKCNQPLIHNYYNESSEDRPNLDNVKIECGQLSSLEVFNIVSNRYELRNLVNTGTYYEVWSAKDTITNETISIKIAKDTGHNETILNEYLSISKYRLGSIYYPLHYDTFNGKSYYLSSEICYGLVDFIGKIDFDVAERFFIQLANAISFFQNKKMYIGDLCPQNILVAPNRILNIMCNAFLEFTYKVISGNKTTVPYIHLSYFSPERFDNEQILNIKDVRSDIWSLGAIMYELITKQLPFGEKGGKTQKEGGQYNQMFQFYSTEVVDYIRLGRLQYIIRRCLDEDPNKRPNANYIRDSFMIRTIKSEKKERLYALVHPSRGILYSIECDKISPFSAQVIPGPGPMLPLETYFMGAFYEDGENCGYLKLEENGLIVKYACMTKAEHNKRCKYT